MSVKMIKTNLSLGTTGTAMMAVAAGISAGEIISWVAMGLTIIGAIIGIIVPIIQLIQKKKEDGKVSTDDVKETLEEIQANIDKVKESTKKGDNDDGTK